MKGDIKKRAMCGLMTITLVVITAVPVLAAPDNIGVAIQKSIDKQVEYTIEHPETRYAYEENREELPDPYWYGYYYGWYGYPYYWDYCHHHEPCWVYSGPSDVTLEEGDTYKINLPGRTGFQNTNPAVASIDSSGNITAHGSGTCVIIATSYDGGGMATIKVTVRSKPKNKDNNNNVVYVPQPVYNPVTTNASWLSIANNLIVNAPKNGTVNLSSATPLSFDTTFANFLKLRPDVTVNVTYGFNGHTFLLTIPKGYNLASKLNAAGTVDFVTLSNVVDGKIKCRLLY